MSAPTNPIVTWNATLTGSVNLYPNYDPTTGVSKSTGVGSVVAAANTGFTGSTGCTAAPAQSGTTIDFSNVLPPASGKTTACDYQNALSIGVTTNDTNGWSVAEQVSLAPGTGFTLCGIKNGAFVSTPSTGTPMGASTATTTSTSINETACGTGQLTLGSGNTTPTSQSVSSSSTSVGTYYLGQDVLLLLAYGTYTPGSYTSTMTVTLTLN